MWHYCNWFTYIFPVINGELGCLTSISTIFQNLWQSILLVEDTRVPREVTDSLYHIMLYQVHLAWVGFELTTFVVIGTGCSHHHVTDMLLHGRCQYHLGSITYYQETTAISLVINYLQTRNNNNITWVNYLQTRNNNNTLVINYLQTRNNNNITRDQLFTNKEQ